VGYRRWGHNEGDEPLFTQPVMYDVIRDHPTARELFARRLVEEGVVTQEEADAAQQPCTTSWPEVLERLGPGDRHAIVDRPSPNGRPTTEPETGVAEETLRELNEALLLRPEGFKPNPRLEKVLQRRRDVMDGGGIDWGHAEALAFASILAEGTPIRLTGQDVERGTFSHRHAVLRTRAPARS
jgi:2-oxoglutarate dehydrogenase E1 component